MSLKDAFIIAQKEHMLIRQLENASKHAQRLGTVITALIDADKLAQLANSQII